MKRVFTVVCAFDPLKRDTVNRIIKPLQNANIPELEIQVVCRSKFHFKLESGSVVLIETDDETAGSDTKTKNLVIKKFYEEYGGEKDAWLYMMDDSVEITNASGFEKFFENLERMLNVFGMNAWLNTRTDGMNYVFDVYNPRYTVLADNELISKALCSDSPVYWTSHANTAFMALSSNEKNWQRFLFDEGFQIPMYYIIDWICRQKEENEKQELENQKLPRWHFMNLYPTVDSEGGLFIMSDWKKLELDENSWREPGYRTDPGQDDFNREQQLFESKKHDINATMNPDPAFKMMYHRFKLVNGEKDLKNA